MLRDAVAVAVEALSWMDLEGLNERSAVYRASRQLSASLSATKQAYKLVIETNRWLNRIDRLIQIVLSDHGMQVDSLSLGAKNFLRIYTYLAKEGGGTFRDLSRILEAGREVIGWRELLPLEYAFGSIITIDQTKLLEACNQKERLELETGHPDWFLESCIKLLGRRRALEFFRASSHPTPTYLHLNSLAGKGDGLLQLLEQEGIMLERVEGIPNLFKTKTNVGKLLRSQNYQNGSFSILDKSSMLAVICCDPKPGYLVADICAAPGNKTGLLAQLMGNRGTIYSIDRSIRRMTLWKREMKRLGIRIAHGIVADATTPIPLKLEADVVLVDPPCSNSGVFSKMPSMKWRINRQKLKNLCRIQASILENSSLLLRSGGILVYSTCSVLAEENEMIVEAFLHLHPEMKLVEIEQKFGTAGMRGLEFCRRLYPNSDECNGSFIAKIVREH